MAKKKPDNLKKRKDAIFQKVVRHMKSLGVYKADYRTVIEIYADLLLQYEIYTEQFSESGYQVEEEYTNKAGATNMRKTPLLGALEKLRADIATYSNMLGLNPKSFENITSQTNEQSSLEKALLELEE